MITDRDVIQIPEGTVKNVRVSVTSDDPLFSLAGCTCSVFVIFKDKNIADMPEHITTGIVDAENNTISFSIPSSWSVGAIIGKVEIRAYKNGEAYGIGKLSIDVEDYDKPFISMPETTT